MNDEFENKNLLNEIKITEIKEEDKEKIFCCGIRVNNGFTTFNIITAFIIYSFMGVCVISLENIQPWLLESKDFYNFSTDEINQKSSTIL